MRKRKLYEKVCAGSKNLRFAELQTLAEAFGYRLKRISGSHHIYEHPAVPVPLNLQDVHGKAKPYQVDQLLKAVRRFKLPLSE
ncbi:MAG: type II toxin-antitoxin system HicA family toxin [Verrucomicrobiota bacterium]